MVDPSSFAGKERKVRCVSCGNEWIEQPKEVAANENGVKRSLFKKLIRWPFFSLIVIAFFACLFIFNGTAQRTLPGLTPIYNFLGMEMLGADTVNITEVACDTLQKEDQTYVIVTGKIEATEDIETPDLVVQLYDAQAEINAQGICTKNCHPITWRFKLNEDSLKEGQKVRFESISPQPVLEDVARCFVGVAE